MFLTCDGTQVYGIEEVPEIEGLDVVYAPSYGKFERYMTVTAETIGMADWASAPAMKIKEVVSISLENLNQCVTFNERFNP